MSAVYTHATLDRPGPLASDIRVRGEEAKPSQAELGFSDLLDIVNPLQHIPVVSAIYREITGDEINAAARVLGGTLFAGPFGTVASVASVAVEQVSGKDPGAHAIAFLGLGGGTDEAVAVAEAKEVPAIEEQQVASLAPVPSEPVLVDELPAHLPPTPLPPTPEKPVSVAAENMEEDAVLAEAPTNIAPPGMASVDAAASFPGNRMPKELLEALYDMHRFRFLHAAAEMSADRRL